MIDSFVQLFLGRACRLDLFEEIVAFVVDENECGKIFHFDFPDGFHAELGIFEAFDTLDIVLSEDSSRTSDTAEVESSVFFAGCLLYTSPSPRDRQKSRMPSSA